MYLNGCPYCLSALRESSLCSLRGRYCIGEAVVARLLRSRGPFPIGQLALLCVQAPRGRHSTLHSTPLLWLINWSAFMCGHFFGESRTASDQTFYFSKFQEFLQRIYVVFILSYLKPNWIDSSNQHLPFCVFQVSLHPAIQSISIVIHSFSRSADTSFTEHQVGRVWKC